MNRFLLLIISAYRALPRRPRCSRQGKSCSALALDAVRAGGGVGDVARIVRVDRDCWNVFHI